MSSKVERLAALRRNYPRTPEQNRARARRGMKSRYWEAVRLGECVKTGCMDGAEPGRRKCRLHLDADVRRNASKESQCRSLSRQPKV